MLTKRFDSSSLFRLLFISLIIALLTSRVTVVLHEFLGHAMSGFLAGGRLTDFTFSLFGNAYVGATFTGVSFPRLLFTSIAGIAVQLVIGSLLLLVQRKLKRGSLARLTVLCFGAINVVESLWYLAVSTCGNFIDGIILHYLLGPWLPYFAVLSGLVLLAAAYFLTALMRDNILIWLPPMAKYKMSAIFILCLLFAGGIHFALMMGESRYFSAPKYVFVRQAAQSEDTEAIEPQSHKEAAGKVETKKKRNVDIDVLLEEMKERKEEGRPFPFFEAISGAMLAVILFASYPLRVRPESQRESACTVPSWRSVLKLFVVFLLSLLPIILLRSQLVSVLLP